MKLKMCLLFFLVFSTLWAPAAEKLISGVVMSANNKQPIPGVTILLKGTPTGTISDIDGKFQLRVPEQGAVLIISFIGYMKQEVEVGDKLTLEITLREEQQALSEVVVVGYGVQKKASLTGATTFVSADDVKEIKKKPTGKTWTRSGLDDNEVSVFIGDKETIPLVGRQISVRIDGFRARVLCDFIFHNTYKRTVEGTFKIKLPNGASPYFFAFGEDVKLNKDVSVARTFTPVKNSENSDFDRSRILATRDSVWTKAKMAKVVPKEKAEFAYEQTIRARVDPLLAQWSGADVFDCRIFPLAANQYYRVVMGYDVNLIDLDGSWNFDFRLTPGKYPTVIDFNVADVPGMSAEVPELEYMAKINGRKIFRLENPKEKEIKIRYTNPKTVLLTYKQEDENYVATSIIANLPQNVKTGVAETAVLALDVSLSSNPDKFNIWLQLAEALLRKNKDAIKQFAVLFFNVETYWWKKEFVPNTDANIRRFLREARMLSLQGASDINLALAEAGQPSWLSGKNPPKNIFFLSDGNSTWGESDMYSMADKINTNDRLFTYSTGMAETSLQTLEFLTRQTHGAMFSVTGEDEIDKAVTGFRYEAWKIDSINAPGLADVLVDGRPINVYPGQKILLTARGELPRGEAITVKLSNGKEKIDLKIMPDLQLESQLTQRIYGQIATQQLEEFNNLTEPEAISYSTYYQVAGKTCSFLMLENEWSYQQYKINDVKFASVKSIFVNDILEKVTKVADKELGSPKEVFRKWLTRLLNSYQVKFNMEGPVSTLLGKMTDSDFVVPLRNLDCHSRYQHNYDEELLNMLNNEKLDYDSISAHAMRLYKLTGASDALKILSSLLEKSPGDNTLARDVAFSAMEWGLNEQAYYLLKRVLVARPNEPQTYLAIAQLLTKLQKTDLAMVFYEISLNTEWESRFGNFRDIAAVDYLWLLMQIQKGGLSTENKAFATERLTELFPGYTQKQPDLIIGIMWNTDNTDIDLHVVEPTGEECYYGHTKTALNGSISKDVTQGYGPEMYTLPTIANGKYAIKVNYYASNRNRASVGTKIYSYIYQNLGQKNEKISRKVVSLKDEKGMITIDKFTL